MDSQCCKTLRRNRPWVVIEGDLATISTARLLDAAHLEPSAADVLIGGPPWQPFSKSGVWVNGETKRLKDSRASTLECYLRVLGEARPKVFLLENVEGLGFRGKDEGVEFIHARLDAVNAEHGTKYRAAIATLNAADFGVPQVRRRMFIIGSRDGVEFKFPEATHSDR